MDVMQQEYDNLIIAIFKGYALIKYQGKYSPHKSMNERAIKQLQRQAKALDKAINDARFGSQKIKRLVA
jgi:hypothetical protein